MKLAQIALEGMQFYAYHGYYPEEQLIGTYYLVDVYLDTNIGLAADFDELGGTVNYETVYTICRLEMKTKSKLIEHVAQRILNRIEEQFPEVFAAMVRISKLHPSLGNPVARSYVELSYSSEEEEYEE